MALRALFGSGDAEPLSRSLVHAQVPELRDANLGALYYGPRMGGDLYDFIRVNPDRILFGLLDVAGRVEENRNVVSAAQTAFRERGAELFAKDDVNEAEAIIELCLELNRTILDTAQGVRPCPAFAGCYHEGLGTVCYFNAGHTPGLLRDGTGVTELSATGLPLGLFSHTVSEANIIAVPTGAALLLVSRGVAEAKCDGAEFGLEQIKDLLVHNTTQKATELCQSILNQLQQFTCAPPRHDDVTALALVRAVVPKAVPA